MNNFLLFKNEQTWADESWNCKGASLVTLKPRSSVHIFSYYDWILVFLQWKFLMAALLDEEVYIYVAGFSSQRVVHTVLGCNNLIHPCFSPVFTCSFSRLLVFVKSIDGGSVKCRSNFMFPSCWPVVLTVLVWSFASHWDATVIMA